MVLYTPYDVAVIMQDPAKQDSYLREVALSNGITLLGRDVETGFKIERIICGNTNAYLLSEYQPGTVVKLT